MTIELPLAAPNFELDALQLASNYRTAIIGEFSPFLRGRILEVGAGIGQITAHLKELPTVEAVTSVEPSPEFCRRFRSQFPGEPLIEGTVKDVPPGTSWDAIVSINVLEHIAEDDAELAQYRRLLQSSSGFLCLFVPARRELYAPIDHDFGHCRRYMRKQLAAKLIAAGFAFLRLRYFNFAGYFAWWLNFCLLKKRHFNLKSVRIFDRVIFPMVSTLERRVASPPIGQSLLAIAQTK